MSDESDQKEPLTLAQRVRQRIEEAKANNPPSGSQQPLSKEESEMIAQCVKLANDVALEMCGGTMEEKHTLALNTITELEENGLRAAWAKSIEFLLRSNSIVHANASKQQRESYYRDVLEGLVVEFGEEAVRKLLIEEFRFYIRPRKEHSTAQIRTQKELTTKFKRLMLVDYPWADPNDSLRDAWIESIENIKWAESDQSDVLSALKTGDSWAW
jgi:ATP-dependent Lon protease